MMAVDTNLLHVCCAHPAAGYFWAPFGRKTYGPRRTHHGDAYPKRYNEIKRMVGGISQRMLTLRGSERDGLVKRTQFPTIPPRVDYELTQLGRSLWNAVETTRQVGAWGAGRV
jgi:hypothetical protein